MRRPLLAPTIRSCIVRRTALGPQLPRAVDGKDGNFEGTRLKSFTTSTGPVKVFAAPERRRSSSQASGSVGCLPMLRRNPRDRVISVGLLVHAYHCDKLRCCESDKKRTCTDGIGVVLRIECHMRSCSNGITACNVCKLGDALRRTTTPCAPKPSESSKRVDRTQQNWREQLYRERVDGKARHGRHMRAFRAVVRCIGRLRAAQARAAERTYAPGGEGFERSRKNFKTVCAAYDDSLSIDVPPDVA